MLFAFSRRLALPVAVMLWFMGGPVFAQGDLATNGVASWFGRWHHGKYTASGEPFDMFAMTAAHRRLPFGTVLQVTHIGNGKSILVRINDRGPYKKQRILDLSYAAADRLDMRISGIARVSLKVVSDESGNLLDSGQAFFVRLDDEKKTDSSALQAMLSRLIRVGFREAAALLHETAGIAVLGPFDTFRAAEEILARVSTIHPRAAIMLADRNAVSSAVSLLALSGGL